MKKLTKKEPRSKGKDGPKNSDRRISWIPACAGMTKKGLQGLPGNRHTRAPR